MTRAAAIALAAILAALAPAGSASAQEAPPPAPPADAARQPQPLPDLDELLGLPRRKPAQDPAPRRDGELERQLRGDEQGDAFEQAVRLMNESAARLEGSLDAGVETQRLQDEAIKRLDQLIAQAQRNRQRQRQQQQQQQQQAQQQDQREQGGQRQSSQQEAMAEGRQPAGTGDRDSAGPAGRNAELNPAQLAGGAAWGNLPAHVREALVQGLADRYSSMYQRLTEEYYRRLAEEPKR